MKQTMKKFASLALAATCAFALTACGNNEEETFQKVTETMAVTCEQSAVSVIQAMGVMDEATIEQYKVSRDDFTRLAVTEWAEETVDFGSFESVGTSEADINHEEGQITVHVPVTFTETEATVNVVFNYSGDYDDMLPAYITVSEKETFGGNMKGAAINTVMGVGCVFAILFFLILVISMFKYVNLIGKKKEEPAPKKAPVAAPAAPAAVEEDLTDDLELVAVIAAAIAAAENTSTDSFVVRSIKKVNRSKWQRA